MLNAEWAYLNRPDRLMRPGGDQFRPLGLLPLQPYQFGRIDQVAFPADLPELPITNPVDVIEPEQQP